MEKVWVRSIFGCYKAVVITKTKTKAEVQLVGYASPGGQFFGNYPDGTPLTVSLDRLSPRREEKK